MSFDLNSFNPDNHTLLGKGVWGSVYDLNCTDVLKIAKEEGGIGSGREKVLHEIKIMGALRSPLIPKLVAYGDIPQGSRLHEDGFAIWLQSTKMPGRALKAVKIEAMPEERRKRVATALGRAMAEFHALIQSVRIPGLKEDDILTSPDVDMHLSAEDKERLNAVRTAMVSNRNNPVPIHGDFNISNVLFDENLCVSGILDFAETCLGHVEDDLCSLTSELPFIKNDIVAAYEEASGRVIDQDLLALCEMKRDLISLLICRYKIDRPNEAKEAEVRLDGRIHAKMGLYL